MHVFDLCSSNVKNNWIRNRKFNESISVYFYRSVDKYILDCFTSTAAVLCLVKLKSGHKALTLFTGSNSMQILKEVCWLYFRKDQRPRCRMSQDRTYTEKLWVTGVLEYKRTNDFSQFSLLSENLYNWTFLAHLSLKRQLMGTGMIQLGTEIWSHYPRFQRESGPTNPPTPTRSPSNVWRNSVSNNV